MRCPTVCLETFVLMLQLHLMFVLFVFYFLHSHIMTIVCFLSLESVVRYQWSAKVKPGLLASIAGVCMLCHVLDFSCHRMLISD